jgi:hypothetical protein
MAGSMTPWSVISISLVVLQSVGAEVLSERLGAGLTRRTMLRTSGAGLGGSLLFSPFCPPDALAVATLPAYCDEAVDVISSPTRNYYLCGTAHISQDSALLVRQLIRAVRPNTVMIELDRPRFEALMEKAPTASFDSPPSDSKANAKETPTKVASKDEDVLRGVWTDLRGPGSLGERIKRAQSNAIGRTLAQMYSQMEGLGFESGDEFRVAAIEALNGGSQLVLGDQDVRTTLDSLRDALAKTDLRALLAAPSPELSKMQGEYGAAGQMGSLDTSNMDSAAVSSMIAMLKERENTRAIVRALQESTPELYGALIAQRDAYMANSLLKANGKTVVAVVGMAHLDGIGRKLMAADPTLRMAPKRGCPVRRR